MSAARPEPCTVCDQPASLRCSRCRASSYCSARCQALLWPTHKVLCGRDPDMFYLPPLSSNEVARLERVKGENYADYDEPFVVFVDKHLGPTWPIYLEFITTVDGLAGDDSPYCLGVRNLNIVIARRHLYNVTRSQNAALSIFELPIWDTFSDAAEGYVDRCSRLQAQEPAPRWDAAGPWRALNGILRQDLVRHTLFLQQRHSHPVVSQEEFGRLSILSFRRAAVEARRAKLPQTARDEIGAAFDECVSNSLLLSQGYGLR